MPTTPPAHAPAPRAGRGRHYDLTPDTARFGAYARQMALIDEQVARLVDLLADLPEEAGDVIPEGGDNSIHWLAAHMAWAEATWIAQASGRPALAPLELRVSFTRAGVLAALTQARQETADHVAAVQRGERPFTPVGPFNSLQELLEHFHWHWVYHSGQVGLLRRLLGHRYRWTFA